MKGFVAGVVCDKFESENITKITIRERKFVPGRGGESGKTISLYHYVLGFGYLREALAKLRKGEQIQVVGEVEADVYKEKARLNIRPDAWERLATPFPDEKEDGEAAVEGAAEGAADGEEEDAPPVEEPQAATPPARPAARPATPPVRNGAGARPAARTAAPARPAANRASAPADDDYDDPFAKDPG